MEMSKGLDMPPTENSCRQSHMPFVCLSPAIVKALVTLHSNKL